MSPIRDEYPLALPPCDLEHGAIKALYTGRFIALPFVELEKALKDAFKGQAKEKLRSIVDASRAPSDPAQLREVMDDYRELLKSTGKFVEEAHHHADLVQTPLWILLNGAAVVERFYLIQAELLIAKGRCRTRGRCRALTRALGRGLCLHLFRRYIYSQMSGVVETMFFIRGPELRKGFETGKAASVCNDFSWNYATARELTMSLWVRQLSRADNREAAMEDCQQALLRVLGVRVLNENGWLALLDGILDLCRRGSLPSLLTQAAMRWSSEGKLPANAKTEPELHLPGFILSYLFHVRDLGMFALLARLALGRIGLSLLPVALKLLRHDPYVISAGEQVESLPGLRVRTGDGEIIIDPPAMTRFNHRLGHEGFENTMSLDSSGYAVDQYLIRKICEQILDPLDLWSSALEIFICHWAGCDGFSRELARSVGSRIGRSVSRMSDQVLSTASRGILDVDLGQGFVPVFLEARKALLDEVESWKGEKPRSSPLLDFLHGYYMHGL